MTKTTQITVGVAGGTGAGKVCKFNT